MDRLSDSLYTTEQTDCILPDIHHRIDQEIPALNHSILVVERASQEPIYQQIARQLRESIATGAFGPGAPLPSVRRLASLLGVNLNTAARAYKAWPDRVFIIRKDGRLGVAARRGPWGFAPAVKESGEWLANYEKSGREPAIQEPKPAT